MTIADIIREASGAGVRLWLKDGQLAVSGKGPVPDGLLDRIRTEKPAITAWLAALAEDAAAQADPILPGVAPEGGEPLSFSQKRLWVIEEMEAAAGLYTVPIVLSVQGALDIPALERALTALVARHDILRTVVRPTAEGAVQHVLPPAPVILDLADLSAEADPAAALTALGRAEAMARFDLANGPMLRARLARTGPAAHCLFLTLHHISTDGWSNGVLLDELARLYAGEELPAPRLQFADFARWQRQLVERRGAALADWWARELKGVPDVHDLPTDRPRPPVLTSAGGSLRGAIPADTTALLRDLARLRGVSLFTLLFTAYAALLHRWSGARDLVVGCPVAGRERDELKEMVGFLVNTLPLRATPDPEESFTDFLSACARRTADAFSHQDLPFEMIVERLNPTRSLSHTPLVQIAFSLAQAEERGFSFPGLTFTGVEPMVAPAKFELSLAIADRGEAGLDLDWSYATDLFEAPGIARLNRGFLSLLDAVARDPRTRVGDLPVVSPAEAEALLTLGTGVRMDHPEPPPKPYEQIEGWAARQPDAVAVEEGDGRWTYGEINGAANRLAHHLIARGLRTGDSVGIATGRHAEMVIAVLAANKAGGVFVQMPVDVPPERLRRIQEDCGAEVILTTSRLPDAAALPGALMLDRPEPWAHRPAGNPPRHAGENCYIVYTSGTTGMPKGAINTHRGLYNLCLWQTGLTGITDRSVHTCSANPAFDAVVWEIWPTLTVGGRLAILSSETLSDRDRLQAAIDRARPSHFWLPTGLMEAMCAAGLVMPASVEWVCTGGDRLQTYPLPRDRGLPLLNIYGPSEASVFTVYAVLGPDHHGTPPIGRPVGNTNAYVLDDRLHLVPEGAVGELCISGPFLGPGYINRPELTAEKYVANPFATPGHDTLYRTGDIARWRPDGQLDCLGRSDFQVKIRGYRIEPQEVAAEILRQPGVRAAFVDVAERGDKRLVAYAVAAEAQTDTHRLQERIAEALARVLPSYMLPDRFVWLGELPLTERGKIDRRALAALDAGGPQQVNTASPRDAIEHRLYDIWSSILLHPEIGVKDNFFDIGGNSLSAIKTIYRINEAFGTRFATTEIVAHPTIEAMGGLIRAGEGRRPSANPVCFRQGDGAANVICIHPAGGTAYGYLSLAKALPAHIGVWGVQSVGVEPDEAFLPDIGAMADLYLTLVEPLLDRPCVLTGASFGGFVAYEMARRLAERGITHVTAVLLDSMGSDDPALRADETTADAATFRQKLVTYNGMYPGIEDGQIAQYHALYNHNTLASRRWDFRASRGRTVLIQAIAGRSRLQLLALRFFWRLRAKGPFLFKVTGGDHSTMLEGADVTRIGRIIEKILTGRLLPPKDRP
ncbi:amino acid adenylation domain-containing protein [Frigidibacter sp. SD6-1]|uniref:non-ribosomal peptide synthetase n=1 Tax=Frigidibacter sp. SD6-1 TaxID=3032581 RepID=UPI0024DFFA2D|nr:amino acid adenylation domain-containing protein [Frigidibacter sp. SD6-1]